MFVSVVSLDYHELYVVIFLLVEQEYVLRFCICRGNRLLCLAQCCLRHSVTSYPCWGIHLVTTASRHTNVASRQLPLASVTTHGVRASPLCHSLSPVIAWPCWVCFPCGRRDKPPDRASGSCFCVKLLFLSPPPALPCDLCCLWVRHHPVENQCPCVPASLALVKPHLYIIITTIIVLVCSFLVAYTMT